MSNIALLFPGQGSQYVGMGKALYEEYEIARKVFDDASKHLGFDIKSLCFEASMDQLTKTENTQLAVFVTSVAAYKVFKNEINIKPRYFLGHSLGEITALACSGVLKFEDALDLVRTRGQYMQESSLVADGGMAAIKGADVELIKKECAKHSRADHLVNISNYNSPNEIVISGHKKAVQELGKSLSKQNVKVIPLKVGAAFHSGLMEPAAKKFKAKIEEMNFVFNKSYNPVISNVTALPYTQDTNIINILTEQIVKPVQWHKSMQFILEEGIDTVIEIGPKNILTQLVKGTFEHVRVFSFEKDKNIKDLLIEESKIDDSINRIRFMERSLAVAICTPNYNQEDTNYDEVVSLPYKKIRGLIDQLVTDSREPNDQELYQCIDMLRGVFSYKGVTVEEQQARFTQLSKELGQIDLVGDYLASCI